MSVERIGKEQQSHEVIGVITAAIDLYWENLLEPCSNVLGVTTRDQTEDGGIVQENYTIQRVYDTAYFIKYIRSSLEVFGSNSPVFATPLETIEFRLWPALFDQGLIDIRHFDVNGIAVETKVLMDRLAKNDPPAMAALEHLQLNLLALLTGHCKEMPLFDPLPAQIRELFDNAYGKGAAAELWRTGMSNEA